MSSRSFDRETTHRTGHHHRGLDMDRLEPRTLFAAAYPFAAVGVHFDGGDPEFYYSTGTLGTDGAIAGTTFGATLSAAGSTRPIDWATFLRESPGRLTATTVNGRAAYVSQVGGQFGTSDGFQPGFLSGLRDGNGGADTRDVAFLLERGASPETVVTYSNYPSFTFRMLRQTGAGFDLVDGAFYVNSTRTTVRWVVGSTDLAQGTNKSIASISDDGTIVLESGERIFVTPGATQFVDAVTGEVFVSAGFTCLVSDTDGSDGSIGIGVGSPGYGVISTLSPVSAVYRGSFLTDGPVGEAALDAVAVQGGIGVADVVLDLGMRGEYRLYNAAEFDAGGATPFSTGVWTAPAGATTTLPNDRAGTIKLVDGTTGRIVVFNVNSELILQGGEVYDAAGAQRENILGQATSFVGLSLEARVVTVEVTVDSQGHPIIHERAQDSGAAGGSDFGYGWFARDLISIAGGKPVIAARTDRTYSYTSATELTTVIGIATDGDVLVWEQMFQGRYRFRNLTEELSGEKITGGHTLFNLLSSQGFSFSPSANVAGAGFNSGGDLLVYRPTVYGPNELPPPNPYGVAPWTFVNVTDSSLTPNGVATPQFAGEFVGYGTTWNGTNIAGLDANGQIVVAWTAPEAGRWYVNNLSQLAGTPALVGPLSPFQSVYSSLHISGVDAAGHVIVTWWTPAISGTWFSNDLTAEFGFPALTQAASRGLVSFTGNNSSHNIVGYDADGNMRVYWWAPYSDATWHVGNITSAIPENERPRDLLRGAYHFELPPSGNGSTAVQDVYGLDDDGTLVRVYWESGNDLWLAENVSSVETTLSGP